MSEAGHTHLSQLQNCEYDNTTILIHIVVACLDQIARISSTAYVSNLPVIAVRIGICLWLLVARLDQILPGMDLIDSKCVSFRTYPVLSTIVP